MSPEDAYSILEAIADIHGQTNKLKKWEMTYDESRDEQIAQEVEEESSERKSNFSFSKCQIPVGSVITYYNDPEKTLK